MKKIKSLILSGIAIALLCGCHEEEVKETTLEFESYPKTTFYYGEEFTNSGIVLKVTPANGEPFLTEDVKTSKIKTTMPGTQKVKVYYTNDEYDIDASLEYEIEVIDWTPEDKAIFSETSISQLSGVYYPKMKGMELRTEIDETTKEITDYWIEKKNSSVSELYEYADLLENYCVTKPTVQNGQQYELTFKFYEQARVPSDYRDLYDEHELLCYKYCASIKYFDSNYLTEREIYATEIEDTLVLGLNDDNDLIVRFIADNVFFETRFGCEVNERLNFDNLIDIGIIDDIEQMLKGYEDESTGDYVIGYFDEVGPLAKDYLIFPKYEESDYEVVSIASYTSLYPWLHGEDDLCFEFEIATDNTDEYDEFISRIESIGDFVKTTRVDKIGKKNVNVTIYTIENKEYVGDLVIEVTEIIPDATTYTMQMESGRETITLDSYMVYYRWSRPELFSPCQTELCKIYERFYGEGKYDPNRFDIYENGSVGGAVEFASQADGITSKEEAADKFVEMCLTDYTCVKPNETLSISGMSVAASEYTNENFKVVVYSYFSGGRYNVEFSVESLKK